MRILDPRAILFAILAGAFLLGRVHAQSITVTPDDCAALSTQADRNECYASVTAEMLYETHDVTTTAGTFVGEAGPVLAVLVAAGFGLALGKWVSRD